MARKKSRKLTIRQLERKLKAQSSVQVSLSPREYRYLLKYVKRARWVIGGLVVLVVLLMIALLVALLYAYGASTQLGEYTFNVWVDGRSLRPVTRTSCTKGCAKEMLYRELARERPYSKIYIE